MKPAQRRLADEMAARGVLRGAWRDVFVAAPRHLFIPAVIWLEDDEGELRALDRGVDPDGWTEQIYADAAIVTQVDDGRTAPGAAGAYKSSSSSQPTVVFVMLDHLDVEAGMSVLEIGTGTGWNAALLAHRLGDMLVTTVEVDPAIAADATKHLGAAGVAPLVITGDGAAGHPPRAPYDRIIATASVRQVPYAWVEQTRAGGVILTPWGTAYHNGALLKLTVDHDGTASGRFVDTAAFMWLRDQRTPFGTLADRVRAEDDAVESVTTLHPYELLSDHDAAFTIGLRVPGCQSNVISDDDADPQHYTVWLFDPASGSWASLTHHPDANQYPIRQQGPRLLWDEVTTAYQWWTNNGRPVFTRYGVTVEPDRQTVWIDDPTSPITVPHSQSA